MDIQQWLHTFDSRPIPDLSSTTVPSQLPFKPAEVTPPHAAWIAERADALTKDISPGAITDVGEEGLSDSSKAYLIRRCIANRRLYGGPHFLVTVSADLIRWLRLRHPHVQRVITREEELWYPIFQYGDIEAAGKLESPLSTAMKEWLAFRQGWERQREHAEREDRDTVLHGWMVRMARDKRIQDSHMMKEVEDSEDEDAGDEDEEDENEENDGDDGDENVHDEDEDYNEPESVTTEPWVPRRVARRKRSSSPDITQPIRKRRRGSDALISQLLELNKAMAESPRANQKLQGMLKEISEELHKIRKMAEKLNRVELSNAEKTRRSSSKQARKPTPV